MSIFKETFRDYIKKQFEIRQKVISRGNSDQESFFPSRTSGLFEDGRLILPAGAWYAYNERQCNIRLASLVDLMKDINLDLGVNNGDGTRSRSKFESYKGSTLARNFILQGGILSTYARNNSEGGQSVRNYEVRGGFPSKKKINLTYGDPSIVSDPLGGDDGYGAVPMPGIVDATIKTDSAYGSLRRAKVNFVCHNLRQLEILELLYMRPGYPVLMEWGWSPYIANDGSIENLFPFISDSDFFWDDTQVSQARLDQQIIQLKESTSGNYDGFVGFVVNFSYQSRSDGGFDCMTELISMGEVIDSLKIPTTELSTIPKETYDGLEESKKEEYIFNSALGALLKDVNQVVNEVVLQEIARREAENEVANNNIMIGGSSFGGTFGGVVAQQQAVGQAAKQKFKDSVTGIKKYLEKILGPTVAATAFIEKDKTLVGNGSSINTKVGYIRWDAFATLINELVIPTNEKGLKPFVLETNFYKTTSYGSIVIDPILYNTTTDRFSDVSCNPEVCILPHQFEDFSDDELNLSLTQKVGAITNTIFSPLSIGAKFQLLGTIFGAERTIETGTDFKDLEVNATIARRRIGGIYIGVDFILETFKDIYKGNPNASLGEFLKAIWDKISDECPTHDFGLRVDSERSNIIQVIDLPIGEGDLKELDYNNLFTFNVQSNDSIVRDFQFQTQVPNALKATIAVNAQSGATSDDLDSVTFAAFNRAIKSRLHSFSEKFSKKEEENYQRIQKTTRDKLKYLNSVSIPKIREYKKNFFNYIDANEDDKLTPTTEIKTAIKEAKSIQNYLKKAESTTSDLKKGINSSQAIIPLNVTLSIDGISSVVIGNVFKIDKTRLPKSYRDVNIAFVALGEDQKITAGQDWITNIRGQVILFPQDEKTLEEEPELIESTETSEVSETATELIESQINEISEIEIIPTTSGGSTVVEYYYNAFTTGPNTIQVIVTNNADLPLLSKYYSAGSYTTETAVEAIRFELDNVGYLNTEEDIDLPKTGTEIFAINSFTLRITQPVNKDLSIGGTKGNSTPYEFLGDGIHEFTINNVAMSPGAVGTRTERVKLATPTVAEVQINEGLITITTLDIQPSQADPNASQGPIITGTNQSPNLGKSVTIELTNFNTIITDTDNNKYNLLP